MAAGLLAQSTSRSRSPFESLNLVLSGFREEHDLEKELMTKIQALGGRAIKFRKVYDFRKCTHVISYKLNKATRKGITFLCGVASGKWILKPEFITDSFARGKWQEEYMYEWSEGDVLENVVPGLLAAPRRWREKIAASGHGAFHGWNVLVHVTNHKREYQESSIVLEAGGGQCVPVTFPFEEHTGLVSLVTHVITETCYEKDVQLLKARGIPCLPPRFIRDYLMQKNPNITQYLVSRALMTPPQAIRQRKIVVHVPTVRTKKDHDTFLKSTPWPRSQGKKTDPVEREIDTPESTMSFAEEGISFNPGKSKKRKVELSLNQLREAPLILNKRMLSSQHLPLVPYKLLMPKSKELFQCTSDNCPSRPFSADLCNFIEAKIEEFGWLNTLPCIRSFISTLHYPPPQMLYDIMQHILLSSSLPVCRAVVEVLMQVLCLHSPACYVSLRGLYLGSMVRPPGIFKAPYHNEPWQFVDAVIRRALGGQHIIQNVKEHEDEEAVKVAMEMGEMLLHFLISLFEEDFMASATRTSEGTQQHTGPSQCILAQILWPSVMEQASRKVPVNVQMLMTRFIQAVKMAAKCDDWVPVTSLLSTLMLRAAEIHVVSGELPRNKNPEKGRKEFAKELASGAKQEGILAIRSCQEIFLSMLKPCVWLCMSVAECILHNYDDQLLGEDRTFWVDQLQTFGNTASHYFSLVPSTAGHVQEEDTGESKSSPLKIFSNQQLTYKNGKLSPNSSPKKIGRSLLTVENKAGIPVNMAQTEVTKEAIPGQRSEVGRLPAVNEENGTNASTSKAAKDRSNTAVKDRSTETLPSSNPNLGKDEGSAVAKLPSEKEDASVTLVSYSTMDEQSLLLHIAKSVPMRKVIDLGTALRFEHVQIKRYSAQNDSGPSKFEGTLDMLHDWTLKQKDNNIQGLLAALEKAEMNKLSNDIKGKYCTL